MQFFWFLPNDAVRLDSIINIVSIIAKNDANLLETDILVRVLIFKNTLCLMFEVPQMIKIVKREWETQACQSFYKNNISITTSKKSRKKQIILNEIKTFFAISRDIDCCFFILFNLALRCRERDYVPRVLIRCVFLRFSIARK